MTKKTLISCLLLASTACSGGDGEETMPMEEEATSKDVVEEPGEATGGDTTTGGTASTGGSSTGGTVDGIGAVANTGGNPSVDDCPYTNDGDCDEPLGTGLCADGTDALDCSDFCPASYIEDGICDEPICPVGTDAVDCAEKFDCGSCWPDEYCVDSCTGLLDPDSSWALYLGDVEVHPTNTAGNWDVDGSAPELYVCVTAPSFGGALCTDTASSAYMADFSNFGYELTTSDLEDLLIQVYDADAFDDDWAGGVSITINEVSEAKVAQGGGAWVSPSSVGVKSISYSIAPLVQ